jgi:hypothetical protein
MDKGYDQAPAAGLGVVPPLLSIWLIGSIRWFALGAGSEQSAGYEPSTPWIGLGVLGLLTRIN